MLLPKTLNDFQLPPSLLQIISEDISELQKNQTTTMAKIAQYKRKLMALSHRTLQVTGTLNYLSWHSLVPEGKLRGGRMTFAIFCMDSVENEVLM